MADHYNLNFMHPQYGTTLNVDIDANFSVQEILEQLVLSGFVGKANAQYDLELMGNALKKQTIFAAIPNLYDGAVLKVVEHLDPPPTLPKPKQPRPNSSQPTILLIQLHCQHADHSLQFSAAYPPSTLVSDVLARAIQQGFLVGNADAFQVFKGAQVLTLNENLQEQALQEGDHLQFHRIAENAPTEEEGPNITLQTLQEQVQQVEQNLAGQVEQLKQQLPRDKTLPDVSELSYESLEKVVQRLRKKGKEPSLASLSLAGAPIFLYVLLVLVFLILITIGIVLKLQNLL
ncbi:MAG: hypothetical protein ACRBFS_24875 [Aureispira sp.]